MTATDYRTQPISSAGSQQGVPKSTSSPLPRLRAVPGRIQIGDMVVVRWVDEGARTSTVETYQIFYATGDSSEKVISPESAAGAVLLGCSPGRTVTYRHYGRVLKMQVLAAWGSRAGRVVADLDLFDDEVGG